MPRDVVDKTKEIKAANDIVDVISSYTSVKKLGSAFKCICPFHNDTNPSLNIDKKHQRYKCWACGAQGDVFTFVEKYERVNFMEARNILAKRAGIVMEKATPEDYHKSRLLDVMKWAQGVYADEYLNGQSAERARHYIGTRQISGACARQFGVGYAPSDNGWLERAAARDGIAKEMLVEVGLLGVRAEDQGIWDRFRDRVMFPIRDVQGRTIGFGGRILPESPFAARAPKYYNTAETMLFSKSHTIFGIDLARHAGSAAGYLAVVEGYTDVMMAHQCGVANVVATMGTALNERHIAHLRRYVPKIVLVFDADDAGNSAADKALELFIVSDLELSIARLPDGLDPADLLAKEDGVTTFKDALENAVDALDFKLNQLLSTGTNTVEGTRQMLDGVLGMLALAPPVPNPITQMRRELMLTRLAHRLSLEVSTVRARLGELQKKNQKAVVQQSQPVDSVVVSVETATVVEVQAQSSQTVVLEKQLVQLLLAEPSLVSEAVNLIHPNEISHTGLRRILTELFNLHDEGSPADLDGLRIRLLDRPDLATAALTLMDVGRGIPDRPIYLTKIIDGFALHRHKASAKEVKERLLAVSSDDDAAALALLQRLQSLPK